MKSPFNTQRSTDQLTTHWLGRNIQVFDTLPSTNTFLKEQAGRCRDPKGRPVDGGIVLADHQNAGRGQHNRIWQSVPGQNLTFSFCYHPHQIKRLPSITLITALACSKAIENLTGISVQLKWPNDLFANGRKLGGILIESSLIGDKVDNLIVGIGINVHQTEFLDATLNATSIDNELQKTAENVAKFTREDVLAAICNTLEQYLDQWDSGSPLPRQEANERLIGYGLYGFVEVNGTKKEDLVKFMGIDDDGFPVFVTWEGDIIRYRHEQVRFHPETMPEL
jgi:BirA family transcriptional regulator, biotin operon repressor / biotin---[acetyl-CoA-carboxylase] ligase